MQEPVLLLPIPLTIRSHAQQFASEQPTPEKAEQVRLNTIAVSVVNNYLQMLDITTNLTRSDSWNPILRICADVADLEITGIGRLECRPMRSSQLNCPIPPEVWESRIGYVVVEIDEHLRQAKLMGFTATAAKETFPIAELKPIEAMLAHLHQLKNPTSKNINLSCWFNSFFETGWEALESLYNSVNLTPAFNFRGAAVAEPTEAPEWSSTIEIRRGKLIDLNGQTLLLVINLKAISEQRVEIGLQVYPTEAELYLPHGLKLAIFDESEQLFMEAQARRSDNAIQLFFTGDSRERFSIKLALEDTHFTEHFVI